MSTYLLKPDYLKNIKGWLDSHPDEVLTLLFTNRGGDSPRGIWHQAFDDSGIAPLAYIPSTQFSEQSRWPTLGQMIESGKRVVVFVDHGADWYGSANYILPESQTVSGAQQ